MTIGETYTFSADVLNSFHATFDRRRDNRVGRLQPVQSGGPGRQYVYQRIPNYTQLSVSSYSGGGFNVGCGTCALANFDINTYQLADDFTIIRGKHQIGFGFDGRKDQFNSYNNQQSNGQFTFNGGTTGDGLADLLIGRFSGLTDGNVISDYLRQTVVAAYVQDAFHATPHFTINIGVRWEPSVPSYDKYGRGNQFSWPLFLQGWHSSAYPDAPAGLIFSAIPRRILTARRSRRPIGPLSRPGSAWFGIPRATASRPFARRSICMHDTTELFYPERWTTNAPYVSSLTLTSGQFSNPFASYVSPTARRRPVPRRRGLPRRKALTSAFRPTCRSLT